MIQRREFFTQLVFRNTKGKNPADDARKNQGADTAANFISVSDRYLSPNQNDESKNQKYNPKRPQPSWIWDIFTISVATVVIALRLGHSLSSRQKDKTKDSCGYTSKPAKYRSCCSHVNAPQNPLFCILQHPKSHKQLKLLDVLFQKRSPIDCSSMKSGFSFFGRVGYNPRV